MKRCLAFVLVLAQVFAETNWVTSGTACTNIWNFSSPSGYAPAPPIYQDHYAAIWVSPVTAGWMSIDWYGADLWWAANNKIDGRIIDISAVQFTDGTTRFDSVYSWESGNPRRVMIGILASDINSTIASQQALGLQVVKLRVYKCGTSVCYNILFELTSNTYQAFAGITETQANQNWNTLTAAGWRLTDISGVQQANGQEVYTQIWSKIPGGWYYWIGSASFFQQKLIDMRTANFYLNHVHVYTVSSVVNGQQVRNVVYMGLFEQVPAANFQWSFIGGLTSAELGKYWNCMNSQYRPLEIASYWDAESHYGR